MTHFAAVLGRSNGRWEAVEVSLADCESVTDIADVARDAPGEVRLLLIEEDDEYAAIIRVDDDETARVFLTDGHAADSYPLAELIAEDLTEIGEDDLGADDIDGDGLLSDAPITHDSAPFGDPDLVDDLGTPASDLLAMCAQEGTLPVDVLVHVCEKAGCGEAFDELRG